MAIMVCGGAGYIGAHTVFELIGRGEEVVIVDNLQTGHRGALNPAAKFYEGDIRNADILEKIFSENKIEAVIHFAANSLVGESVQNPLKYFNNNVGGMQILLEAMTKFGSVRRRRFMASRKKFRLWKLIKLCRQIPMANPS